MYETITFGLAEGLATLTLNRPDRLNSFTDRMHDEVADALAKATRENGARALLLTGAGRGFCAGQDLNDRAVTAEGEAPDLGAGLERWWNPLIRRLSSVDLPVVCAVNGVAAGAGVSLALACDVVLAARSARFVLSFAALGLIPDTGLTWALPRAVGLPRALGMALTGEPVPADRAESWGLIWRAVDDAALADEASALARRLAAGPTEGLAATRAALRGAMLKPLDQALDDERDIMRRLGRSDDYREGVAAFLAKRKPSFTGR